MRLLLALLLAAVAAGAQATLPKDVAAMHPDGSWKVRKADLYRYLVRFNSGQPSARAVLPDYMKRRLVEAEARRRKLSVTEAEITAWLQALDERMQRELEAGQDLNALRREMGMKKEELRRRAREWLLNEKVARDIFNERDPTRPKDRLLSEDSVILAVDELFHKAPKEYDRAKLPDGVVARVGEIEITEYEYGRALAFALPATEVYRAILDLVLVEETRLLVGNDDPPSAEDLAAQKEWYLEFEKNRLRRQARDPDLVTDDVVRQVLEQRGLTLDLVYSNPAFLAQARARGHFRRALSDEDLKQWYDTHQDRYGARVRVARILVAARAQRVIDVGQKVRTLEQGKQVANEIWLRLHQGEDFLDLARRRSDDPDAIRLNGGIVPFWLTADTPGYQDAYVAASGLETGKFTKPFFSQGRGYLIVKLLEREEALSFASLKPRLRRDAAEQNYQIWRREVSRAALKNEDLLAEE